MSEDIMQYRQRKGREGGNTVMYSLYNVQHTLCDVQYSRSTTTVHNTTQSAVHYEHVLYCTYLAPCGSQKHDPGDNAWKKNNS